MNTAPYVFIATMLAIPLWAFVIYPPKPDSDIKVFVGGLLAIVVCFLLFVVGLIVND